MIGNITRKYDKGGHGEVTWLQEHIHLHSAPVYESAGSKHFTLESNLLDCLTIKVVIRFIIEFLV